MSALMAPRPCANCAAEIAVGRAIYCCELCDQTAKAVRYARGAIADRRIRDPDVQLAVRTRIAFIAGGGYDERARQIPPMTRAAVRNRAGDLCEICGDLGEQIDHINGSSSDPSNLQLLCASCHRIKTEQSMQPASAELQHAVHEPLRHRIEAEEPRQPSDIPKWAYRRWAQTSAAPTGPWAGREGPATPPIAAAGWPPHLDPWALYPDAPTAKGTRRHEPG